MPDEFEELTKSLDERKQYFTPRWFGQLLSARLSLGDTFWIGNFGILLFVVPALVIAPILLHAVGIGEQVSGIILGLLLAAFAVYLFALLRAVFITAGQTPDAGVWRWVGVFITLLSALSVALLSVSSFAGWF
ncbi:hypothetical protein [Rhizobium sp. L1K21]|uniref:hypothetical protein n=1 Tax=Rhizobium sp. L1K21 TaxID=2954933 RepID=UPI0020925A68|nr:hypothetical protein [Rhizobium sp. L1K21]MCO6186553.1 hypothetical protein [Rhizobium sp. L1K21]